MDLSILSRVKGQAFATDFLGSVVVLGFMLSIFVISWNSIVDQQISNQQDQELYQQGERTINQLMNDEGEPEAWNGSNVERVGFADQPHVLNSTKVEAFNQLDKSEQQSLLNAIGFRITVEDNSTIYEIGETPDSDQVFSFERKALLNQSGDLRRVEVRYAVWR